MRCDEKSRLAILVPEGSRQVGDGGDIGNIGGDVCWCIERKAFQHRCAQTNGGGNGVFVVYIFCNIWKRGPHDAQRGGYSQKK